MARPTKFNEDVKQAIIDAISIGATYKDASEAAGISYHTFNNWLIKGHNAKKGLFFEFFHAVEQAKAKARLNYTKTIAAAAAKGDWRAALEYLKRRDRDNWGDGTETPAGDNALEIVVRYEDGKRDNTDPTQ